MDDLSWAYRTKITTLTSLVISNWNRDLGFPLSHWNIGRTVVLSLSGNFLHRTWKRRILFGPKHYWNTGLNSFNSFDSMNIFMNYIELKWNLSFPQLGKTLEYRILFFEIGIRRVICKFLIWWVPSARKNGLIKNTFR